MSNTAVGAIYSRVIDAVVDASRTDFEEHGVSNVVLEGLREKWQNRLSQTDRATFPWDPEAHPPPLSKVEREPSRSYGNANGPANGASQPNIKQEFDTSFLTLPPRGQNVGMGTDYASQRAVQLMQQQFGSQANNSIQSLQAEQMNQRAQQQPQQFAGYPQQSPYATLPPQGQPRQPQRVQQVKVENKNTILNNGASHIKQENGSQPNGFRNSQTDGAGDAADEWDAVVAVRNSGGDYEPMGRLAIDRSIRSMVERNAQRLEGGGLMVPLDERLASQRRQRTTAARRSDRPDVGASSSSAVQGQSRQSDSVPRFGGDMADDDEEEDEDAINSDLDDPDETADTTIEGLYEGDVILCLYDKVQRVKNKWKCVLREGILTIDGKDYVFHKASGEFEW